MAFPPPKPALRHPPCWICALLVAGVLLVFSGACRNGFVDLDDGEYATDNPVLRDGFSVAAFRWAFTPGASSSWHPLTWCSHLLDWQLFGSWAAGHHLSSLFWHAGAAGLAVSILGRLSGLRRSWGGVAFGAAWWALHPLRVESVAWVAERKDVMCVFFMLLAVWCHVRMADAGKSEGAEKSRWLWLTWTAGLGAVLSKGMGVTLPLLLILLDLWLGRIGMPQAMSPIALADRERPVRVLWGEKWPLWLMVIATGALTYFAQHNAGAVSSDWPLSERIANGATALVAYWRDLVWPSGLAVFYPHPRRTPPIEWIGAFALIAGLFGLAWRGRHSRPWWLFGLAWFVVGWLPVSGLVQAGLQARADRFAYLPSFGFALALAIEAERIFRSSRWRIPARAVAGAAVLALAAQSVAQTAIWRDAGTLFTHAALVTKNNYYPFFALGDVAQRKGDAREAIRRYAQALEIYPEFAPARFRLGLLLDDGGDPGAAISHYRLILANNPNDAQTHMALGAALAKLGHREEAIQSYHEALRLAPNLREANFQIALLHTALKQPEEAIRAYEAELLLQPRYVVAHNNLANLLVRAARPKDALAHYDAALLTRPDYAEAWANSGMVLWQSGDRKGGLSRVRRAFFLDERLPGLAECLRQMESASQGF